MWLNKLFKPALLNSGAARDVMTLASGRLSAAIISFLAVPFIARLFTPDEFGVAALFVVVVTLVSQLLPLAYQNAIVIPKNESDAIALARTAFYFSIVLVCLMYLSLVVKNILELAFPLTEHLSRWEWAVPVTAFMLALSLICEAWLTRKKGFVSSAKATFFQALMTSGGRLSLGAIWGASIWGLVVPYIAGVALRLGILMRAAWHRRIFNVTSTSISNVSREFSEFPKYNLSAGLLRALSDNLPVLLFAPFFGVAAAGLYAMADRLVRVPLLMGTMSVRRVYLQRASVILHRGGNLKSSYLKITGYLAFLGLAPFLLLMLVGEPLLSFILGDRWTQAGVFVEILAPWLYLMLVTRPATALVDLLRQQRLWLRVQIASGILRVSAMMIVWSSGGTDEWVLWAFVLAGMPPYFWVMYRVLGLINSK